MNRTPDQEAADNALEGALRQIADAYGVLTDTDYLGHWLTIMAIDHFDPEEDTAYLVAFQNGRLPRHVSYGLLHVAEAIIDRPGWHERD